MHFNRISAFLLGAWLLGSLFLAFVAAGNFATVDAVLKSPPAEASKILHTLGNDNARQLLRHLAGEENRGFFETWELAELFLGAALTCFLLLGARDRLLAGLAGCMVILTAFQHFKITPDLLWLGRSIDFLPAAAQSQARNQFSRLHGIYGGIELVKLLMGFVIAGFLFVMRRRRSRRRVEVDAVDYAHHRHVDR